MRLDQEDAQHPEQPRSPHDASEPVSRRAFLGRVAALGTLGIGLPGLLAACGGDEPADGAAQDAEVAAVECDYTGLTAQDEQVRETLGYVSESPNANQICANCQFYIQPEGGNVCGGCTLFAGLVNPGGWCESWALARG